jgi:hypothetical protein
MCRLGKPSTGLGCDIFHLFARLGRPWKGLISPHLRITSEGLQACAAWGVCPQTMFVHRYSISLLTTSVHYGFESPS